MVFCTSDPANRYSRNYNSKLGCFKTKSFILGGLFVCFIYFYRLGKTCFKKARSFNIVESSWSSRYIQAGCDLSQGSSQPALSASSKDRKNGARFQQIWTLVEVNSAGLLCTIRSIIMPKGPLPPKPAAVNSIISLRVPTLSTAASLNRVANSASKRFDKAWSHRQTPMKRSQQKRNSREPVFVSFAPIRQRAHYKAQRAE